MTLRHLVPRDLEADLAICAGATPGPWIVEKDTIRHRDSGFWLCEVTWSNGGGNARFIAEAREGWPYAIHRALAAEREIDRLRNENAMLLEALNQRGCGL